MPHYIHPFGTFALSILQTTATTTKNYQHEVDIGKIIAIPLVFFIVLVSCLIPQALVRVKTHAGFIIQILTCLAGGALLSIGLLHIIPHARENFELYEGGDAHAGHNHFQMQSFIDITEYSGYNAEYIPSLMSFGEGIPHATAYFTHDNSTQDHHFSLQQTTVVEESAHDHGFPWTELCAGLVIILLMSVEQGLHVFLVSRKSTVHLHEHGGNCDHAHCQNDQNQADPDQLSNSHCNEQVIEIYEMPHADNHQNASKSVINTCEFPNSIEAGRNIHSNSSCTDPTTIMDAKEELTPEQKKLEEHKRAIDAYVSCIAISLHCIFNGMALGATNVATSKGAAQFWTFFGATVGHKICDALAVSIPLAKSNLSKVVTIIIILGVSFATPLGIIIGYFTTSQNSSAYLAQAVLLALSSGSFFYIAMIELIPAGTRGSKSYFLQWFIIGIGFALPAVIAKYA